VIEIIASDNGLLPIKDIKHFSLRSFKAAENLH